MPEVKPASFEIKAQESVTYGQILEELDAKLFRKALAVDLDGKLLDLNRPATTGGRLSAVTFEEDQGKELFWHSSAHVLAQALKRLYPDMKFDDGPALFIGPGHFYYDVYSKSTITEEDFPRIEEEIAKIIKENHHISRRLLAKSEAIDHFSKLEENFKVSILKNLPEDAEISLYKQGEFEDLCRGPHVSSTGRLGTFKLTTISGAYWKGDPANPMLQRIYGVSFPDRKQLKEYFFRLEEAKKRDHRKLGKELRLFSFQDEGPGFPFYHPRGTVLFNTLAQFIREECAKRGYSEIRTPQMLSDELWHQSGHYENFKENMYFTSVEEKGFAVKPMNCPGSNLIFKSELHSYRDLPVRMAELGLVHRHELSGVLHGLFRVRAFTQDDAHIYCTADQLQREIQAAIQFTVELYNTFGFQDVQIFVATRPERSLGKDEDWEQATESLVESLGKLNLPYKIKEGEGAFYGPKIEFNIRDSLGRNWQCGTIQVDFSMPERFELEYVGADGKKHRPVMVHRAILGSLERFMGILLEHYAGKLPLWLSPVQVSLLTVSDEQHDYAKELKQSLEQTGIRCELDLRNEKIGYKIRAWNSEKINYAVILGKQEQESKTVSLRARGEQATNSMGLAELVSQLKNELAGS